MNPIFAEVYHLKAELETQHHSQLWKNPIMEEKPVFDDVIIITIRYVVINFPRMTTIEFFNMVQMLLQDEKLRCPMPTAINNKKKKHDEKNIVQEELDAKKLWTGDADNYLQRSGLIVKLENGKRIITFKNNEEMNLLADHFQESQSMFLDRCFTKFHEQRLFLTTDSPTLADRLKDLYRGYLMDGEEQAMKLLKELCQINEKGLEINVRVINRIFFLMEDIDDYEALQPLLRNKFLPWLASHDGNQVLMLRMLNKKGGISPLDFGENSSLNWLHPLLATKEESLFLATLPLLLRQLKHHRREFLPTIRKIGKWLPNNDDWPLCSLLFRYMLDTIQDINPASTGELEPSLFLLDPEGNNDDIMRLIHGWLQDSHRGYPRLEESDYLTLLVRFLCILVGERKTEKIFDAINKQIEVAHDLSECKQILSMDQYVEEDVDTFFTLLMKVPDVLFVRSEIALLEILHLMVGMTGGLNHESVFKLGLAVFLIEWHFKLVAASSDTVPEGTRDQLNVMLKFFHQSASLNEQDQDWLSDSFMHASMILSKYIQSLPPTAEKKDLQWRWRAMNDLRERNAEIIKSLRKPSTAKLLISLLNSKHSKGP